MSISLEAREVLTHLNALGYRNISAEQLKEFMRDLKKLIKYENRIGALSTEQLKVQTNRSCEPNIFDKLYGNKTQSIEAKYGANAAKSMPKNVSQELKPKPNNVLHDEIPTKQNKVLQENQNTARSSRISKQTQTYTISNSSKEATGSQPHTAPSTATTSKQKSTLDSERRPKTPKPTRKSKQEGTAQGQKENRMWIRPPMTKPQPPKTKDAVQLYHFYQKEWAKFKQQLPGENDHSELRWRIRHKLMGDGS